MNTASIAWPARRGSARFAGWMMVAAAVLLPTQGYAQGGPAPVQVANPVVRELVEWTEFSGRFDAVEFVSIRSRVGGYLASVHFRDGTMVSAGDLLFTIDKRPFQASLDQAEGAVASAQTRINFYAAELERAQRLVRTGAGTERTVDERRQQFQEAQADIQSSTAAVRQARLNLEFTEIRAPIAGRISRRLVTEGNLVQANETLLTTIVSLDPIYFYFDMDERTFLALSRLTQQSNVPSAASGQVEVRLALADEADFRRIGIMDFVDNRMDQASGTVRVRAIVRNEDGLIAPGLFGRVNIPATPRYSAVLIPDEAISADLSRRFVYVVNEDGQLSQKTVRTGPREFGYRVVREGLDGSETIVVNGIQRIRPNAPIAPQRVELPPQR